MIVEARNYSLWSTTADPAWTGHNAGVPDVLIVHGLTESQARSALERLRMLYQDDGLEIRLNSRKL
ncbi:hypothetical protein [Streptomyces millisiae]|uniref:Uncharacterized protein n=1 Tax=Streptomyces millisiae TaxID=3075542 RepID=A0ABU2LLQ4_9ACTN|nr:hypothetical protein [Streptomyces sp. DSM 44918]MDT0318521.1 hypothetical protein [Streptomyces sp. DSM 44918]